jgi:methylglyoxal synthase
MSVIKSVALVAHDNRKQALVDWAIENREKLLDRELVATGTTGKLIEQALALPVVRLSSGPLGGDQQLGAKISEQKIDLLIFFWDPLEPMSHDPDIKALLRVATLWNIPIACNKSSADFIIHSPLLNGYEKEEPNFDMYLNRKCNANLD